MALPDSRASWTTPSRATTIRTRPPRLDPRRKRHVGARRPAGAPPRFRKTHDFFVGIDSDGCAFDTMEVKHKECFIPNIVRHFGLAAVSKYAREAAEFVNLYSKWRGINRFPGLTEALDLLAERPEVASRGFRVPGWPACGDWIDRETKLGNPTLRAEVERPATPTWRWPSPGARPSTATIGEIVHDVPPFPCVRESLEMHGGAGRRDGRLGDPRRGPRPRVGRARPGEATSP